MPPARRPDMQAVHRLGVRRLTVDSRAVRPGDTFVAYPGESRDGRDYIPQAIANGAASVLWDADNYAWNARWRVPSLGITHLRRYAGLIASEIYGKPSAQLWTIGVTGTNGKTSCSQWIAQSLTRARRKCAVIPREGHCNKCGRVWRSDERRSVASVLCKHGMCDKIKPSRDEIERLSPGTCDEEEDREADRG